MSISKTWVELLGNSQEDVVVDGSYISKVVAGDPSRRIVIHQADDQVMAREIMRIWTMQIAQKQSGLSASPIPNRSPAN